MMQIRAILPRDAKDPAHQFPNLRNSNRQLDRRYDVIQKRMNEFVRGLKSLRVNSASTYRQPTELERRERTENIWEPVLATNEYIYELDASRYMQIDRFIEQLIYEQLLGTQNGVYTPRWWLNLNLEKAYTDSIEEVVKEVNVSARTDEVSPQLSQQMSQMTPESLLFSPPVQRRLGLVYARVFNEMKGLSDESKVDLAETLTRAMSDGVGIPEINKRVKKRLQVSYSRARRIARTEILNAYRSATADETRSINEELTQDENVEFRLLWFSALAPTTRRWHAAEHGEIKTREWVKDFYSRDANAINCLCAQRPILVFKKSGEPIAQKALVKRLKEQVNK